MAGRFRQLSLVCLNVDGVLLPDSFSPVVYHFLSSHGVPYTPELERLELDGRVFR